MVSKSGKNESLLLVLTIIPVTDFIGANWFYLKNTTIGWIKAILSVVLIAIVLYLYVGNPGEEAWGALYLGFCILAFSIAWWLVDVYLLCIKDDSRK